MNKAIFRKTSSLIAIIILGSCCSMLAASSGQASGSENPHAQQSYDDLVTKYLEAVNQTTTLLKSTDSLFDFDENEVVQVFSVDGGLRTSVQNNSSTAIVVDMNDLAPSRFNNPQTSVPTDQNGTNPTELNRSFEAQQQFLTNSLLKFGFEQQLTESLNSSIVGATQQTHLLAARNDIMKYAMMDILKLGNQLAEVHRELKEKNDLLFQAHQQLEEDVVELQQANSKLDQAHQELEQKNNQLKSALDNGQAAIDNYIKLLNEHGKLENQADENLDDNVRKIVKFAQEKVREAQNETRELEKKYNEKYKNYSRVAKSCRELDGANRELTRKLQTASDELENARGALKHAESEKNNWEEQRKESTKRFNKILDEVNGDKQNLQEKLTTAEQNLDDATKENESLELVIKEREKRNKKLLDQGKKLKNQLDDAQDVHQATQDALRQRTRITWALGSVTVAATVAAVVGWYKYLEANGTLPQWRSTAIEPEADAEAQPEVPEVIS